jgi:hypothetical protein
MGIGNLGKISALMLTSMVVFSTLLFTASIPLNSAQIGNTSPTFTVSIVASINNYSSTCEFGVNPDAPNSYSPQYDSVATRPSSGVYFFLRYSNQTILTQKLSRFIVPSSGYTTWFLEVDGIDQYGKLTLSWNDTAVSTLVLEDGASKRVDADMNSVNSFSFTTSPGSIIGFIIVYHSPGAPSPTPTPSPFPTPTPTPTLPPSLPIPTPTTPEFTVKWEKTSYQVPTSYTIDPYTGQNITNQGYYVDNSSIVITITNQPFTSFIDNIGGSPWNIYLFYAIQEKGHYVENWTNISYSGEQPIATSSQYTVLTYPVQHYSNAPDEYRLGDISVQIPVGGQIDFRVQAMIGYFHKWAIPLSPWVFEGQTSDWSNTQTITVSANASPPTPTPTVPELPWLSLLPVFISLFLIAIEIRIKRTPLKNDAEDKGKS